MRKRLIVIVMALAVLDYLLPNSNFNFQIAIPLVIPLAMAGVSAASAAMGAIKSADENRKNKKILAGLKDDAQKEYLSSYYRDTLENPGARSYLKMLDRTMKDNTKATENRATATGATHENVLAAKESNNRVMSDAIGGLVANEQNRKDASRERYLQRKAGLAQGEMGQNAQRAQNWSTLGQNISNAAGSLASAYLMSNATGLSSQPDYSIAAGGPGHSPQYKANFIKNIGK